MYDGLLLLLGVMINILEHCTSARLALDDLSLKKLANLYINNRKAVGDVSTWPNKHDSALTYLSDRPTQKTDLKSAWPLDTLLCRLVIYVWNREAG